MPSRIDQNLIPPAIREAVDPDILNRAQSIEWSINRDTGEDEHGYLDGGHEDYIRRSAAPQGYLAAPSANSKAKMLDYSWSQSGRDSGFEHSPTSPSLIAKHGSSAHSLSSSVHSNQRVDLSPLDDTSLLSAGNDNFGALQSTQNTGSMKRHPLSASQRPFPIYKVNQNQLEGDVVFDAAPSAKPGERTVHYEKNSRVLNEEELNAMGLDPNFFGPNSRTTMDEQEEEMVETSVLKGGRRELERLYQQMRTGEAGDYFEQRQRARSVSPSSGNRLPIESEQSEQKRTVIFGSVDEINTRDQEFYPYRDAHQGKPLPGDNEYGTWGSRYDEKRQWKLCNGQWVRVAEPKAEPKPKYEKYMAERVKCKPPKKIEVAKAEPVRQIKPQSGSTDDPDSSDNDNADLDVEPELDLEPEVDSSSLEPIGANNRDRFRKPRPVDYEPVDIDALKDKYRPKSDGDDDDKDFVEPKLQARSAPPKVSNTKQPVSTDNNRNKQPTGTILLEPIRPPTPPLEEIKVEPIQPTYVEMKKPLKKPEGEEEKMMEDPNLMWMRMGPAQYGPPFGSLRRRKAREEEWIGPPCELCHKQIEERRCMLAENRKFHCWHFACSFCLKTLKPADFLIAQADGKPYCLNCHKREFPEISLINLRLDAEEQQQQQQQ